MVFSSLVFLLVFLPFFLLGYHIVSDKYKNGFALLASVLFYAWGASNFVLIAIASIIIDYYLIYVLSRTSGRLRFIILWTSILFNLSFLLYYKYYNFFIENINAVVGPSDYLELTSIVLPIGISFFTFQKISYSIDVYRKTAEPLKKVFDYGLYIMLFPQLIAGPIVRYNEIASQLKKRSYTDYHHRIYGFYRFSIGLAKKVIIANVLGEKADIIFALDAIDLNTSVAWLGVICYTFQIYFDFSGYSDMAIGLGYLMGFKFPENFNSPYIAQSITEFWKRWHITLGSWMRDYLYIPLGGNRVKTNARLYINLWVVFLISGLWHGASWNFVLWGAFHGLFLVLDRLFLNKLTAHIGSIGRVLLTFLLVMIGWVLFRTETLLEAQNFYRAMFSFEFSNLHLFVSQHFNRILIIAVVLSFALYFKSLHKKYLSFETSQNFTNILFKSLVSVLLLIVSVANLSSSGFNPFIYFRF